MGKKRKMMKKFLDGSRNTLARKWARKYQHLAKEVQPGNAASLIVGTTGRA